MYIRNQLKCWTIKYNWLVMGKTTLDASMLSLNSRKLKFKNKNSKLDT